jgi:hypothetical protein
MGRKKNLHTSTTTSSRNGRMKNNPIPRRSKSFKIKEALSKNALNAKKLPASIKELIEISN